MSFLVIFLDDEGQVIISYLEICVVTCGNSYRMEDLQDLNQTFSSVFRIQTCFVHLSSKNSLLKSYLLSKNSIKTMRL